VRPCSAAGGSALAALVAVAVGCNEPAVGFPIEDAPPPAPSSPSAVVVEQAPAPGQVAVELGAPVEVAALAGAWLPFSDLSPPDRQVLASVFNLTPAPCEPCGGRSVAACLVELPPAGCENIPALAERARRLALQGQPPDAVQAAISYGDAWVPVPALDRPADGPAGAPVPVHLWMDPHSPALGAVIGALDQLQLNGVRITFHFGSGDGADAGPVLAGAAAARAQGRLEAFLRELVVWRAERRKEGDAAPTGADGVAAVAARLSARGQLDLDRWDRDQAGAATAALLAEDAAVGAAVGVRSYPTWFVGGYRLRGAQSSFALQRAIDLALDDHRAAGG